MVFYVVWMRGFYLHTVPPFSFIQIIKCLWPWIVHSHSLIGPHLIVMNEFLIKFFWDGSHIDEFLAWSTLQTWWRAYLRGANAGGRGRKRVQSPTRWASWYANEPFGIISRNFQTISIDSISLMLLFVL